MGRCSLNGPNARCSLGMVRTVKTACYAWKHWFGRISAWTGATKFVAKVVPCAGLCGERTTAAHSNTVSWLSHAADGGYPWRAVNGLWFVRRDLSRNRITCFAVGQWVA